MPRHEDRVIEMKTRNFVLGWKHIRIMFMIDINAEELRVVHRSSHTQASLNLFASTLCNFTNVVTPSSREHRALDAVPVQTISCVPWTNNVKPYPAC